MVLKAVQIYRKLLEHFGSQGWWPTTPKGRFRPVYHSSPRIKGLTEKEKFEICAGSILAQNTAWKNVGKALVQLNRRNLLSAEKIAKISIPTLEKSVRSAGYFRQKAKKLKIFSNYILNRTNGCLKPLFQKP